MDTVARPSPLDNPALATTLAQIRPHPVDVRHAAIESCVDAVARVLFQAAAIYAGLPDADWHSAEFRAKEPYRPEAILAVASQDRLLISRARSRAIAAIPGRVEGELGDEVSPGEFTMCALAGELMIGLYPTKVLAAYAEERR